VPELPETDKFGNPYAAEDKVFMAPTRQVVNYSPRLGETPPPSPLAAGDVAEQLRFSTSGFWVLQRQLGYSDNPVTARVSGQNALSNLQVILEGEA